MQVGLFLLLPLFRGFVTLTRCASKELWESPNDRRDWPCASVVLVTLMTLTLSLWTYQAVRKGTTTVGVKGKDCAWATIILHFPASHGVQKTWFRPDLRLRYKVSPKLHCQDESIIAKPP